MRKSIIGMALICILIGIFLFTLFKKNSSHPHFHAAFVVYVNGIKQDYSKPQFMHVDACSVNSSSPRTLSEEDKVHLHNNIGDIAHVHDFGATWGLLFKNMGITFPKNMRVIGYKDGKQLNDILDTPIQEFDSVIIVAGTDKGVNTHNYLPKSYIESSEKNAAACEKP